MPRTAIIVLAVFALVGAGAAFLLSGDEPPEVALPDRGDAPKASRAVEPAGVGATARPVESSAFVDRGEGVTEVPTLTLLVVDEHEAPAPGATVEIFRNDRGRGGPTGFGRESTRRPWRTLKADHEGRVALSELPLRGVTCIGRAEKHVGQVEVAVEETLEGGTKTLVLKPVKSVEVAVVDAGGAAVPGVRVTASAAAGFGGSRESGWTSDPEGKTTFEITALDGAVYDEERATIVASLPGLARVEEKAPFVDGVATVILRVPPAALVRVDVKDLKGATLALEKNLTWSVEGGSDVMIDPREFFSTSPFGSRSFEGASTVVGGFRPGAEVRFELSAEGRVATSKTATLPTTGLVHVVEVELGPPYAYVVAKVVDDVGAPVVGKAFTFELARTDAAGVAEAAAESNVDDRRSARVNGRRSRAFGGFAGANDEVVTDADGSLKIPTTPGAAGTIALHDARDRTFRRMVGRRGGREAEPEKPLATRAFETTPETAEVRVEDVVVPRKPIVAAGVVVDAAGAPVRGAIVRPAMSGLEGLSFDGVVSIEAGVRGFDYGELLEAEARTDAQGKFELRADAPETIENVKLSARTRRGRSEETAFTKGALDLRLVVVSFGGFKGTARLTSEEFKGSLTVVAESAGGAAAPNAPLPNNIRVRSAGAINVGPGGFVGASGARRSTRVDPKTGAFHLRDLLPGRYDVVFRHDGSEAVRIRDVEVRSDETNEDPRLKDVLIGGDFFVASVVVLDDAGRPVRNAAVRLETARDATERPDFFMGGGPRTDAEGRWSQVFTKAPIVERMTVTARDFKTLEVERPSFPTVVRLDRGATLTVAFDIPGGLPRLDDVESWRLRARLKPNADEGEVSPAAARTPVPPGGVRREGRRGGRGGFDAGAASTSLDGGASEATLRALGPGSYELVLSPQLVRRSEDGGRLMAFSAFSNGVTVGEAVVPPGVKDVRVTIALDGEALRKLAANEGR